MTRKYVLALFACLALIWGFLYRDWSDPVQPAQAAPDHPLGSQSNSDSGFARIDHSPRLSGLNRGGFLPVLSPPNQPVLVSPGNKSRNVNNSPTLEVTVSDRDKNNLTVTFYGRPASLSDSGENFTIIAIPDTQFYTGLPRNNAIISAQTRWIVDNRGSRNIAFVTGLGDIVQNGDNNGNQVEWHIADAAYALTENPATTLLSQGIPYGLAVGNHDQSPAGGGNSASTTLYNKFFGTSRFQERGYYGGHYDSTNNNNFQLFSAAGMEFIIIHLEYDPTPEQAVLNWAANLLAVYSNRRAIVTTHYLIGRGNSAEFSEQGAAIYNALKGHTNLFLMLGGHICGEGRRQDTALNGNIVHSVLSDYQCNLNGGDGWLRIMTFFPANDEIKVQTYSPTRNGGNGEFQTDADSQFVLKYGMKKPSFQVIGTQTGVPSGSTTRINWRNLKFETEYEWFVTLNDSSSLRTGPVWTFTTLEGRKTFLPLIRRQ